MMISKEKALSVYMTCISPPQAFICLSGPELSVLILLKKKDDCRSFPQDQSIMLSSPKALGLILASTLAVATAQTYTLSQYLSGDNL